MEDFGFLVKKIEFGKPLTYSGDIVMISKCIDGVEAKDRYRKMPDDFMLTKCEIQIYGQLKSFMIPCVPIDPRRIIKDLREDFVDYVTKKATSGWYTDAELGMRLHIIKEFIPLVVEIDGHIDTDGLRIPCVLFCQRKILIYMSETGLSEDQLHKDLFAKSQFELSTGTLEENLALISMKEFIMGYARVEPFTYIKKGQRIDMQIGQHYNFLYKGEQISIPYNYTIQLRKAMFGSIREPGQQLMRNFQYDALLRECKSTYMCTLRRQGKTVNLAYQTQRGMMREGFEDKHKMRPVSVIYLSLNEKINEQVRDYIANAERGLSYNPQGDNIKMFKYDSKLNIQTRRNEEKVYGKTIFLSEGGNEPGVGMAGDLLIIDECFKIRDEKKSLLDPIVDIEGADYYAASTMYKNSEKNFAWKDMILFEKNLKQFQDPSKVIRECYQKFKYLVSIPNRELEHKKEYIKLVNEVKETSFDRVSLRYDIDQLTHIPDDHKEKLKHRYLVEQNDPLRYYTELYCRFPDEDTAFKYEPCLRSSDELNDSVFTDIISALDPAMDKDQSGFIQVGWNDITKKIVVFRSTYLKRTGLYTDQANEIKGYLKESDRLHINVNVPKEIVHWFAADGTGQQKAIVELLENNGIIIHGKFKRKGGTSEEVAKNGWITVSKAHMVGVLQVCFDNEWIIIDRSCTQLITELKNYKNTGSTWEALQGTDDLVSALLMAVYMVYNKLSKKYTLANGIEIDPTTLTGEQLREYHKMMREKEVFDKKQADFKLLNDTFYETHIW